MAYKNKKDLYRNQIQRWVKRKIKAIEYLGGKCINCGYCKHPAALQFHHRDPKEKQFMWTKLRLQKWQTVLTELDKCDLLCANCHAEEHFSNFKYS